MKKITTKTYKQYKSQKSIIILSPPKNVNDLCLSKPKDNINIQELIKYRLGQKVNKRALLNEI